ncbi:MAG TPA: sigma-70 family RNA polymerase sigma factor [Armatimonadota bacterium]
MSLHPETHTAWHTQWEAQCDFLKRLLISLTRDLDLAEDLLQDTYLLACRGWAGFRGGDVRAWLATIARHAFYSHCRKRYVRAEEPLETDMAHALPLDDASLLVAVRQAIAGLPPALRDALLMKHYGGFSYHDIAERQRCPVGTAKWRVSTAITRVQALLGITGKEKIMALPITRLLDYLYGRLPEHEAATVRAHLAGNAKSRAELQAMEQLLRTLDAIESEVKCSEIAVLDAAGGVTRYFFLGAVLNCTQETVAEADWTLTDNVELRAVLLHGHEAPTRVVGQDGKVIRYKSPFPQPIRPGESFGSAVMVTYEKAGVKAGDVQCWHYRTGETLGSNTESWVYLQVVRLPPGATLLSADPPADEVRRKHDAITLTWRYLSSTAVQRQPGEWQIAGDITYRLTE